MADETLKKPTLLELMEEVNRARIAQEHAVAAAAALALTQLDSNRKSIADAHNEVSLKLGAFEVVEQFFDKITVMCHAVQLGRAGNLQEPELEISKLHTLYELRKGCATDDEACSAIQAQLQPFVDDGVIPPVKVIPYKRGKDNIFKVCLAKRLLS